MNPSPHPANNIHIDLQDFLETINANTMFMAQCIIAAVIGGLEFCFPALFVDTFNTFEVTPYATAQCCFYLPRDATHCSHPVVCQVYTSHRLYGATMIVNAIIVFAMRKTSDHRCDDDDDRKTVSTEAKSKHRQLLTATLQHATPSTSASSC